MLRTGMADAKVVQTGGDPYDQCRQEFQQLLLLGMCRC